MIPAERNICDERASELGLQFLEVPCIVLKVKWNLVSMLQF
jgi:hypothetical protein